MSIRVSVIVPTHNTGDTIVKGINSLRVQSMPREQFEVIYVDDGSTDNTPELIASEIHSEDNFHLVRIENSGWPGKPRNIGMQSARGEYVHFADDDDWLAPEALERLYRRAVETGADIVCGRMAGHGRAVPRILFEKPMSAGDIRRNTILLSSMTVHKLFRKNFLDEHEIRFPEGKVRLEDHMFMLRAYLSTERVATVHDYTCYHWVRHISGQHNISFGSIDPEEYLGSVARVIEILSEYISDGELRDRFIAHWYSGKVLGQLLGSKFLQNDVEYRERLFAAVRSLVSTHIPARVDSQLHAARRVVSALVRHGRRDLCEKFAAFEAGTTHEPRLTGIQWHGDDLRIHVTSELRRIDSDGSSVPMLFTQDGNRWVWKLPDELTAVPGVKEAADFTEELAKSKLRGMFRYRDESTELFAPTVQRLVTVPVESPQAGQRITRLRFECYFPFKPENGNQGKPLAGIWDAHLRLDSCGWSSTRRLGANREDGVEAARVPAFTGARQAFVNPYWTSPYGNLSLSIDGTFTPLNRAVRRLDQVWSVIAGSTLEIDIPLAIAPPTVPVPVCLRLETREQEPIRIPATVQSAPGPGQPLLSIRAPEEELAAKCGTGSWDLQIERSGRSGHLGLRIRRDAATGIWHITR
ncbi:glycosyltransferase family 2 protein [Streptomyces sp. x-80]|uniref:glycosyltransferase family 2 protein n=1 Tax=Streptomyces sp. x-80 TaxID=2789282 RepID=UPI00397FEACB